MAKDRSEDPSSAKKEKKDKKDKKRKHTEVEPTTNTTAAEEETAPAATAEKPKKKAEKSKTTVDLTAVEQENAGAVDVDGDGDIAVTDAPVEVKDEDGDGEEKKDKAKVKVEVPLAALVPFANPLCDEKAQKKVLKGVKKGRHNLPPPSLSLLLYSTRSTLDPYLLNASTYSLLNLAAKNKALKRGVKECVKAIRKSPPTSASPNTPPVGIVILAADISPMDVISHIPVLCEDHHIPYLYVPSRAELGAAGATKRPTSVVMLGPKVGKGVEGGEGEWEEVYGELWRLAVKLGQVVKV
ncbi:hypothetical protein B0A55_07774 [Friedmanniomyces simplex]|uniref:Ribosomal protein eL8/eL30/eS12/Gadd45 domain-containing protein n=1 Tax=Friedmanniomyces simplex TaxID=329884 RepID=A0A4V5NIE3_9PEZI|nr:hypothetical protein B0A55_07774 [Friedmanniomyces simplex]